MTSFNIRLPADIRIVPNNSGLATITFSSISQNNPPATESSLNLNDIVVSIPALMSQNMSREEILLDQHMRINYDILHSEEITENASRNVVFKEGVLSTNTQFLHPLSFPIPRLDTQRTFLSSIDRAQRWISMYTTLLLKILQKYMNYRLGGMSIEFYQEYIQQNPLIFLSFNRSAVVPFSERSPGSDITSLEQWIRSWNDIRWHVPDTGGPILPEDIINALFSSRFIKMRGFTSGDPNDPQRYQYQIPNETQELNMRGIYSRFIPEKEAATDLLIPSAMFSTKSITIVPLERAPEQITQADLDKLEPGMRRVVDYVNGNIYQ